MRVKIEDLKLNPYNEKIYETKDIDQLSQSIAEVGLLEKIVVNESFRIVSGHRRYLALKSLGYTTIDVEVKNIKKEDELLHLISYNKQRIKSYREVLNEIKYLKSIWGQKRGPKTSDKLIQLNPANINTRTKIAEDLNISSGNIWKLEFIDQKLPELIAEIDSGRMSINQAHLYIKNKEKEKKKFSNDKLPPITISKQDYKIYNKSSDDLSDLLDESVQTIVTSPPFWKKRYYSKNDNELGSEKTSEEFVQRLANHLHYSHRILKNEGSMFLNLGDTYDNKCLQLIPHRVIIVLIQKKGWILRNTIIWKKKNTIPAKPEDNLTPSYEFIFHLVKSQKYYYNQILLPVTKKQKIKAMVGGRKARNNDLSTYAKVAVAGYNNGKKMEDFWNDDIVNTAVSNQSTVKKYAGEGSDHPAPYPTEIATLPILQTSKVGDVVLDLFSGTGTTGEVALLHGRKYIGYEINPMHNKLQERRLDAAVAEFNESNSSNSVSEAL